MTEDVIVGGGDGCSERRALVTETGEVANVIEWRPNLVYAPPEGLTLAACLPSCGIG